MEAFHPGYFEKHGVRADNACGRRIPSGEFEDLSFYERNAVPFPSLRVELPFPALLILLGVALVGVLLSLYLLYAGDEENKELKALIGNQIVKSKTLESELEGVTEALHFLVKEVKAQYEPAIEPAQVSQSALISSHLLKVASVSANKVYLRTGPGIEHSPLMAVKNGSRLIVEEDAGEWLRVIAPSGERAWVKGELVAY